MAVCGEALFLDKELDTLLNPVMIAEILSPLTEDYDCGEKFERYKEIASLKEYVLASQDEVCVVRLVKQGDAWVRSEIRDIDAMLVLESIGCAIPLREVYARVELGDGA